MILRCPECDCEIVVPKDSINGEIFSCLDCGTDLEFKNGTFIKAELEGEDWGE